MPSQQFVQPQDPARIYQIVTAILTFAFTLMSALLLLRVAKIGLDMSNAGDNPQLQAATKSGLLWALVGGVVFFAAGLVTGVMWYFASK